MGEIFFWIRVTPHRGVGAVMFLLFFTRELCEGVPTAGVFR